MYTGLAWFSSTPSTNRRKGGQLITDDSRVGKYRTDEARRPT